MLEPLDLSHDLYESLSFNFDLVEWTLHGKELKGRTRIVSDKTVYIELLFDLNHTVQTSEKLLNGVNIGFSTSLDGVNYSQDAQEFNIPGLGIKIFSGVYNEVVNKLPVYNRNYFILSAKENVEKRSQIYKRLSNKLAQHFNMNSHVVIGRTTINYIIVKNETLPKEFYNSYAVNLET